MNAALRNTTIIASYNGRGSHRSLESSVREVRMEQIKSAAPRSTGECRDPRCQKHHSDVIKLKLISHI